MKTVCLDTHILIWSIKEQSSPGQEYMIPRAKKFLEYLESEKYIVLIPAIVVAELLMRVPPELHATVTNLLDRSFVIPPFDLQSSTYFARIWQDKQKQGIIKELQQNYQAQRDEIKADCMIVAIALSRGAECIYSYDKKLRIFANGHIEVEEIPIIPNQPSLFQDVLKI